MARLSAGAWPGLRTDHDGPQQRREAAEAAALLHQRLPQRLLLGLLQQVAAVSHVLQGHVQLGLQVPTTCHTAVTCTAQLTAAQQLKPVDIYSLTGN